MRSYQDLLLANVFYNGTSETCKRTRRGEDYNGTKRTTTSGKACIKWSEAPKQFLSSSFREMNSLRGTKNKAYCRNPDLSSEGPWCFTNRDGTWEYCDIPYCEREL